MSEIKHTPTPWRVETSPVRRSLCIVSVDAWICGELSNGNGEDLGEGEANADFIVRACNNFEAVLAALKIAEDALSRQPYSSMAFWPSGIGSQAGIDVLRNAIAKAEGKP